MLFLSVFTLISCNAQTDKKTEDKQSEVTKSEIKPKVDYKVNKEYDENGNLIRLDSTYTYYYSNIDKDAMMNDSIFKKFNKRFNMKSPFMSDDFFDKETFIEDDFFSEDFFRGNFKRNQEMMQKMMSRMDSLKNQLFMEEFLLKKEKDKN